MNREGYSHRVHERRKSSFEKALSLDRPSLIEVPLAGRQQELIDGIAWLRTGLLRTR